MSFKAENFQGSWLLPFYLVVYFFTSHSSFQNEFYSIFFNDFSTSPADAIPWYFIHRDFVDGVCSGIGWLFVLIVAVSYWNKFRNYSFMVVWMSTMTMGYDVYKAIIIYLSCDNLFNVEQAATIWQTFDEYTHYAMFDHQAWLATIFILTMIGYFKINGLRSFRGSKQPE